MSDKKSVLVRATIGDNMTVSFPDGNVVASMKGRVRFENFTNLKVEVRFEDLERRFHVTHDEAVEFKVEELKTSGKHEFTLHEVTSEGHTDDTVYGEGAIVVEGG
ncbi:hypothetical protein CWE12_13205 [Aliidiomarina sedimenti]|uniref:Uncharacterized protein n=1 Tax=Aliidiomarina sedimenti TaxID=1933879 RepID=A0ABY0BUG1_9GAMM|nr:hypothetical protein [Aliidiomarina sedimenti]RUO27888.1 hypothetical protein CWE12_13205 [Aliidiomarina sedimenti]